MKSIGRSQEIIFLLTLHLCWRLCWTRPGNELCTQLMTSCQDRCSEGKGLSKCDCSATCVLNENCCPDYESLCAAKELGTSVGVAGRGGGDTIREDGGATIEPHPADKTKQFTASPGSDSLLSPRFHLGQIESIPLPPEFEEQDFEEGPLLSEENARTDRNDTELNQTKTKCIGIPVDKGFSGDTLYVKMVTTCPHGENGSREGLTKYQGLCHWNGSVKDGQPELFTPVVYNMTIFKNYYCLMCNELVSSSGSEVVSMSPNYACDSSNVAKAKAVLQSQGMESFLRYIAKACRFYLSYKNDLFLPSMECECKKISDDRVRQYMNVCEMKGTHIKIGKPYQHSGSGRGGQAECAFCTDGGPIGFPVCLASADRRELMPGASSPVRGSMISSPHPPPSFSLLLDFGGGPGKVEYGGEPVCEKGSHFDLVTSECVPEFCPPGQAFIDNACSTFNGGLVKPTLEISDTDHIYLSLSNVSFSQAMKVFLSLSEVESLFGRSSLEMIDCASVFSIGLDGFQNRPLPFLCAEAKTTHQIITQFFSSSFPYQEIEAMLDGNIDFIGIKGALEFQATNINLNVASDENCTSGILKLEPNFAIAQINMTDYIMLNHTGTLIPVSEAGIVVSFRIDKSGQSRSYYVLTCEQKIQQCKTVVIGNAGYYWNHSQPVVNSTGESLDPGSYLLLAEGQLIACASLLEGDVISGDVHAHVQGILTILCLILSVLGLTLTLVTYSIFGSLRTVPGLCIMHLCVALLGAQVLFLVGPLAVDLERLCVVLGAVQHFLWLAAFMWTNVLAYKIFRTFSSSTQIGSKQDQFRYKIAYAWGTPLVFVIACVLVDVFTGVSFGYGGTAICWMTGNIGVVAFFAAPLLLMIVVNAVFFLATVVMLKRTTDAAKQATHNKNDRNMFKIYVRLSSIMGFTWLFGLLANIKYMSFFWYFFILFNALQGLFICLAFVVKRRVLTMYKVLVFGALKDDESQYTQSSGVNQ